ncbi:MAG: DUF4116 domain-containing protein [Bacteroidaceae bacterium]|nr:DUF4116 domain-containing protein [Bacteroidaceae bacterium]
MCYLYIEIRNSISRKQVNNVTPEEKDLLIKEIPKYIQENCYDTDGSIKSNDLWLVGWVAAEFHDRKNAMRVLINNEYGLLGNLLNKLARHPDASITHLMERADLEVILKAIKTDGNAALQRNELDTDPYAMRLLVAHDVKYARHVNGPLLSDKDFLLSVVGRYPEILQNVSARVLSDEEFVLSLVKKNYACLKFLPRKYHSDYRMCLEAAKQEGFSLMYFDFSLREKDEIVLTAVSNRGNALSLATPRQKKDRDIVYAAVRNCGLALDYADDIWKHDFDLVATAVSNRGMALRYAAPELQDCEQIVRLAVANDGYAMRSASKRLRDHYDLAVLAITTYTDAYLYLSPRLQADPEIQRIYSLKKEEENKWLPSKMR